MQVHLLKPFFGWETASCLFPTIPFYREPYHASAALSFFVLPMPYYYSSPICFCSQQQITVWLFLSSGQPTVCFLFRLAASLPHCLRSHIVFHSVCLLLFMECKTAVVQGCSLELYYAHSQAAQSLPRDYGVACQRQEAFCHLCLSTSLLSIQSNFPAWLTLLHEDEVITSSIGSFCGIKSS